MFYVPPTLLQELLHSVTCVLLQCKSTYACFGDYATISSRKYNVFSDLREIYQIVSPRDRGPLGITSVDFPSKAGSALVLNSIVLYFSLSHGKIRSHRLSAFPFIFQEVNRMANRKNGTPVTAKSPTVKCPKIRP